MRGRDEKGRGRERKGKEEEEKILRPPRSSIANTPLWRGTDRR